MSNVIRKRLQVQPLKGPTIDRSLTFVVGTLPDGERRKLRGVVFEVATQVEALRMYRDLHQLAKSAVAENKIGDFLDGLDQRTRADFDPGPLFEKFADEWFKTCVKGVLRESQEESDKSILANHLVPFFGRRYVRDIDARLIDQYKAKKRREKHQYGEGYSAKTINNHLAVLHRVCNKAIEYGVIEKNPVTKTSWMRSDRTSEDAREWWRPDEEAKAITVLLEQWRETRPGDALALLAQIVVGLRFSELRALEKQDLDLQVPGLWIRRAMARKKVSTPKNKRARFHVIPRDLAEELRRWMLRTEGQFLFPDPRGGALANKVLNRWYRELADASGIRRITSHGARHTSGSSYAVMGAGQKMIAHLLGHADTAATERYTHIARDATAALVEARWTKLRGGDGKR